PLRYRVRRYCSRTRSLPKSQAFHNVSVTFLIVRGRSGSSPFSFERVATKILAGTIYGIGVNPAFIRRGRRITLVAHASTSRFPGSVIATTSARRSRSLPRVSLRDGHVTSGGANAKTGKSGSTNAIGPWRKSADENL